MWKLWRAHLVRAGCFFCNETSISVMCLKQQWSRKACCNSPREWCASLRADWQLWCSDHQDAASSPSGWKKNGRAERRRETRWLKMTAYDSLWFDWKQQQTWIWRKMPPVFCFFFNVDESIIEKKADKRSVGDVDQEEKCQRKRMT